MSEPDQPTLRDELATFAYNWNSAVNGGGTVEDVEKAYDEAEAAIRLLVAGAAPEKWPEHADMTNIDQSPTPNWIFGYNTGIDQYTENLRGRLG